MSTLPLVSIITPSYNQAAYIEQTMQSVFAQEYPNLEYLVVDGDSNDGSQETIQRFDHRLSWWVSEKDSGQAEAINKGLHRAQGQFVAWLNSDDIYLPGAVAQGVAALQNDPALGMVYGDAITIDPQGRPLNRLKMGDFYLPELMRFRILCQPAVFMRRSVVEQVGYLDPGYHFLLDHHLWIRMARQAGIQHIPSYWAGARHHPQAKNVAQASGFGLEAMRILDWMRTHPGLQDLVRDDFRHIQAGAYRLTARYLLDGGQPLASLNAYARALVGWPEFTLQHSHRMAYALLSLVKANRMIDRLRAPAVLNQRNRLMDQLKNEIFASAVNEPVNSWPGLDLNTLT